MEVRSKVLSCALLLWAAGCKDEHGTARPDAGDDAGQDGQDGGQDASVPDPVDAAVDAGTDASEPPVDGGHDPRFGLDTRPPNPTCVAPTKPGTGTFSVMRAFGAVALEHPVAMVQAPGADGAWYAIEQNSGKVKRFAHRDDVRANEVTTLLDLDVLAPEYETDEIGLLGIALDPAFAENRFVYLFYTPADEPLRSTIARFTLSADGARLESTSKLVILEVPQPYRNHKGGQLAFGPDGLLYVGIGDGGGGDDQHCFAQDPAMLYGKFLRLDVRASTAAAPYAIPPTNPFASGGGRPEIYALGVRNPWRWSFDRATGELWAGDVGQNAFEEIDRIERGKNYGWKAREGASCFEERSCSPSELYPDRVIPPLPACNDARFTPPVYSYGRDVGAIVTGGYVYRGNALGELAGDYVYGDFGNGTIWALEHDGTNNRVLVDTDLAIAAFAEGNDGELYAIDWLDGGIHLLRPGSATSGGPKTRLSETGCVDPSDPTRPVEAMIPYELRVPFWSDGAKKDRWFAIPDGTTITVHEDGDLELPPGSVTMKRFQLGGKTIETRFFVRWADGSYGGYTYRWNDEGTDAVLLDGALSTTIGDQSWYYPAPAECDRCHDAASGGNLGLETIQLDRDLAYPSGVTSNQLGTLAHIEMLTLSGDLPEPLALVDDANVELETRARAYLHANCANCHRPGGPGRGAMDMRYHAEQPALCNQAPLTGDLGVPGALIVSPGRPEESVLYLRMARRDDKGMPPLASAKVDEAGAELLRSWIAELERCPRP